MEKVVWIEDNLEKTRYFKIIEIENIEILLILDSPCSEDNELDISFHKKNGLLVDFEELIGFKNPIKAFRKIVKELLIMIEEAKKR